MATDDKNIKINPPSHKEAPPNTEITSGADPSKADDSKIADASVPGYSRGEGQKPVSKAYKDNWNAIYAKKKKR
jgi:hypothetical protein